MFLHSDVIASKLYFHLLLDSGEFVSVFLPANNGYCNEINPSNPEDHLCSRLLGCT